MSSNRSNLVTIARPTEMQAHQLKGLHKYLNGKLQSSSSFVKCIVNNMARCSVDIICQEVEKNLNEASVAIWYAALFNLVTLKAPKSRITVLVLASGNETRQIMQQQINENDEMIKRVAAVGIVHHVLSGESDEHAAKSAAGLFMSKARLPQILMGTPNAMKELFLHMKGEMYLDTVKHVVLVDAMDVMEDTFSGTIDFLMRQMPQQKQFSMLTTAAGDNVWECCNAFIERSRSLD